MDHNENNKQDIKNRLVKIYNENRLKFFSFVVIIIISVLLFFFLKIKNDKYNLVIANKYIQANLKQNSLDKAGSKILYEEIILSKNKFYSVLALNNILEKNLITDKDKILNYFQTVKDLNKSREKKDLLNFKLALYLLKINEKKDGEALLNKLIEENSTLKPLAEELFAK